MDDKNSKKDPDDLLNEIKSPYDIYKFNSETKKEEVHQADPWTKIGVANPWVFEEVDKKVAQR